MESRNRIQDTVKSHARTSTNRRIWAALSICWGTNAQSFNKANFPYPEGAYYSALLWRNQTGGQVTSSTWYSSSWRAGRGRPDHSDGLRPRRRPSTGPVPGQAAGGRGADRGATEEHGGWTMVDGSHHVCHRLETVCSKPRWPGCTHGRTGRGGGGGRLTCVCHSLVALEDVVIMADADAFLVGYWFTSAVQYITLTR